MYGSSSKELFKDNGGQKMYIYRDGFGDVYSATPEEEYEWTAEMVTESMEVLEKSDQYYPLQAAVERLMYHVPAGMEVLLLNRVLISGPIKKIVFATALWRFFRRPESFKMILDVFESAGGLFTDEVFRGLQSFGEHPLARQFFETLRYGTDELLALKATRTMGTWDFADLPAMIYHTSIKTQL